MILCINYQNLQVNELVSEKQTWSDNNALQLHPCYQYSQSKINYLPDFKIAEIKDCSFSTEVQRAPKTKSKFSVQQNKFMQLISVIK